jgi:hypothetical protein
LDNPEPNTAYWVDDRYLYVTDDRRRVAFVQGTLYSPPNGQVRDNYRQRKANKTAYIDENGNPQFNKNGKPVVTKYDKDQGGHLIGAQFGGPPERINYVPQSQRQNNSVPSDRIKPSPSTATEGHPDDKGFVRNWYESDATLALYVGSGWPTHVRITPRFIGKGTTRPNDILLEINLGGIPQGAFDDKQSYPN